MDNVTRSRVKSERTTADVIGCVASLVDAFACLIFLVLPATPATGGRLAVLLLLDPITCVIGYWVMYQRLLTMRPKWSEFGFYLLISGTLFLTCQNVLAESASLNFSTRDFSNATEVDILLEVLVTFTLPVGVAIYAWLIASSPPLRRWLGFMMGIQAVLMLIALGSFAFPQLSDLVTAQLMNVYAIILSLAKALWFLYPVAGSKYADA